MNQQVALQSILQHAYRDIAAAEEKSNRARDRKDALNAQYYLGLADGIRRIVREITRELDCDA